MNVDLAFLSEYVIPVIFGTCLCIGYILKNIVTTDAINKYIPLIVAIVGVGLNAWINASFTAEILFGGLVSGLASTGLHQIFKQFIGWENKEGE